MPGWTPHTQGPLGELPPILTPLFDSMSGLDLRPHVRVLSGLRNDPCRPDGPGDHAAGTAGFLTCTHIHKSETDIRNNISLYQVYAKHIGDQTHMPSLQLGIDGGADTGNCDSGYGCAYSRNISWASETQPLPKVTAPQLAFDLLFAGSDPGATQEELERRKALRLSVLDAVTEQTQDLNRVLGQRDRAKLDEYMTGVRDLETRIEKGSTQGCDASTFNAACVSYPEHIAVMIDLMVLAMQCDATRVITFMQGNATSYRSHDFLGIAESHHDLSHHGGDAATQAKLQTINTWEVQQLAQLLAQMQAIDQGERTLLDNSLVLFSSEIEGGNSHSHSNMPIMLAGHAGDQLDEGWHHSFTDAPVANFYVSILRLLGVDQSTFGDDGTGPLQNFS